MATYSTPIPGVPQYGQAALAAKTAYQKALARLNQRRGSLLRQTGFTGDINAETGVVDNTRIDPMNKYGGIQMLNRSQADRAEGAEWGAIGRGLGSGGGLAAQMQAKERFDFGKEDSDLGQGLIDSLGSLQDEQTSAAQDRDSALYQAELDAARFAIQQESFNPADFGGLDQPAYGADAPAPTSSKAGAPAKQITSHRQMEMAATARAQPKFFTYKKQVPLKRGETLGFTPGKGYYAKGG